VKVNDDGTINMTGKGAVAGTSGSISANVDMNKKEGTEDKGVTSVSVSAKTANKDVNFATDMSYLKNKNTGEETYSIKLTETFWKDLTLNQSLSNTTDTQFGVGDPDKTNTVMGLGANYKFGDAKKEGSTSLDLGTSYDKSKDYLTTTGGVTYNKMIGTDWNLKAYANGSTNPDVTKGTVGAKAMYNINDKTGVGLGAQANFSTKSKPTYDIMVFGKIKGKTPIGLKIMLTPDNSKGKYGFGGLGVIVGF